MSRFPNRREAGRLLAERLSAYADRENVVVLALPRGGVPVAFEIARALGAPLDVFAVRKIGHPWNEELAIGAIATGGVRIVDEELIRYLGISRDELKRTVEREEHELDRRERLYRDHRVFPDLMGRIVILVDDGLATGASAHSAVEALRAYEPRRSSWRLRSDRVKPAHSSGRRRTNAFATSHRNRSTVWGCGTMTSRN